MAETNLIPATTVQPQSVIEASEFIDKYQIVRLIQQGIESYIVLVSFEEKQYCAKIFRNDKFEEQSTKENLLKLDSPYIVKVYDVFTWHGHVVIIMEYLRGLPNLRKYIRDQYPDQRRIPEKEALEIFKQLIYGLNQLHAVHIIHRNINHNNILMDGDKPIIIGLKVVKQIPDETWMFTSKSVNTYPFQAPELLQGNPYSYKVDIWSIGVVLFVMLFREYPFGNQEAEPTLATIKAALKSKTELSQLTFRFDRRMRQMEQKPPQIDKETQKIFIEVFQWNNPFIRIDLKKLYKMKALNTKIEIEEAPIYDMEFKNKKITMLLTEDETAVLNGDKDECVIDSVCKQCKINATFANSAQAFLKQTVNLEKKVRAYMDKYNFQISKYQFLIHVRQQLLSMCKDMKNLELIDYYFVRHILYHIMHLKYIMHQEINAFHIEDFHNFIKDTNNYKEIYEMVIEHEQEWEQIYHDAYENVESIKDDIQINDLKENITSFLNIDYKEGYLGYSDQYKIPFRAVTMETFGKAYKQLETYTAYSKDKLDLPVYEKYMRCIKDYKILSLQLCACLTLAKSFNSTHCSFKMQDFWECHADSFTIEKLIHEMNDKTLTQLETPIRTVFTKYFKKIPDYKKISATQWTVIKRKQIQLPIDEDD